MKRDYGLSERQQIILCVALVIFSLIVVGIVLYIYNRYGIAI
jgi:hypothetical protein